MNYSIRTIENGIIIGFTVDGSYKETAFTDDNATYVDDAKLFITENKGALADSAEEQAHNRIDQLTSTEQEA